MHRGVFFFGLEKEGSKVVRNEVIMKMIYERLLKMSKCLDNLFRAYAMYWTYYYKG